MANQHVNKVAVNGQTVLDLSGDTVYPGMLAKGITAHDKSGAQITGTLEVPATEERTVELSMPSGNQVILPTSGKVMRKVAVQKPATLLPENIKKDVVIGGVTGTLEASSSGGAKETWVLNNTVDTSKAVSFSENFVSNGLSYKGLKTGKLTPSGRDLVYTNSSGSTIRVYFADLAKWEYPAYRKITFDTPPTGDLLTWLQANGVKQPDYTAIQDSKSLTITSNGTVSVTPDVPYDALKKVDVTVDVASGGAVGETTSLEVKVAGDNIETALFCLWQTGDGWIGTTNFDTTENFTIPNVIVGGYVIFTRNPSESWNFAADFEDGIEDIGVGAMDAEFDIPGAALVMKVTAPSPRFYLRLLS